MNYLPSDASFEGVKKGAAKYGSAPEGRQGGFPERRNAGTIACVGCNKPGMVDDMQKTENGYMCANCMPAMKNTPAEPDAALSDPEKREKGNHGGTDEPGEVLGLDKVEGVQTDGSPENKNGFGATCKICGKWDDDALKDVEEGFVCHKCAGYGSKKNGKPFRFKDVKGDIVSVDATSPEDAWVKLSADYATPVADLQGMGIALLNDENPTDKLADDPDAGEISNVTARTRCPDCGGKMELTKDQKGIKTYTCRDCDAEFGDRRQENDAESDDVAEIECHVEGIKHEAKELEEGAKA